jgi:hypothetical protein
VKPKQQANIFFDRMGNEDLELGTGVFVYKRTISAVKRVEFITDRMSYIILRGYWYNINFLNVHARKQDKISDMKYSFYEELECVFDKFPKYHINFFRRFQCQSR